MSEVIDDLDFFLPMIEQTMFFTGQRPKSIGKCYVVSDPLFQEIKENVKRYILAMVNRFKIKRLVFGGAQGWDQIAFWSSYELCKSEDIECELIVAIPYKDQPEIWKWENFDYTEEELLLIPDDKLRNDRLGIKYYYMMLIFADYVVYVDSLEEYKMKRIPVGQYHVAKLDIRNHFMVDISRYGLSFWNGAWTGGTYNCLKYAESKNRRVLIVEPKTYKVSKLELNLPKVDKYNG